MLLRGPLKRLRLSNSYAPWSSHRPYLRREILSNCEMRTKQRWIRDDNQLSFGMQRNLVHNFFPFLWMIFLHCWATRIAFPFSSSFSASFKLKAISNLGANISKSLWSRSVQKSVRQKLKSDRKRKVNRNETKSIRFLLLQLWVIPLELWTHRSW